VTNRKTKPDPLLIRFRRKFARIRVRAFLTAPPPIRAVVTAPPPRPAANPKVGEPKDSAGRKKKGGLT
jgi:hypothetical protein